MRQVFVDTAVLVVLGNRQNDWHDDAVAVSRQLSLAGCRFVTTDTVLLELGNTFSRSQLKPVALCLIETALRSRRWHCLAVDRTLLARGLDLFRQRSDKDWRLTDCISLLAAKHL